MATTTIAVNEISAGQIGDLAMDMLNATRTATAGSERFAWLYQQNPDGDAIGWTVGDDSTDYGFTVALPRRVVIDGRECRSWNGADFSILPRYRALGVAIKLRRAAKIEIDRGRASLLYAHPNDQMALIHTRVGHMSIGTMVRYARAIAMQPHLNERMPGAIAALAARPAELVGRIAGREIRHRLKHDIRFHSSFRFDSRFDELFNGAKNQMPVIGVRDSRYLNWRYSDNPLYETEVITAESGNRLAGYLAFAVMDNVAHIKDVFPPKDTQAIDDLICGLIREGRRRRLKSLSFGLLDGNPLIPHIRSFGFRQRSEKSQMFAYAPEGDPLRETILDGNNWFITVGDRDV